MTTEQQTSGLPFLTPRDLINVGIFAAVYFVILFLTALIGFISPPLHLAGIMVGTLINATVTVLFMARTPKLGAITLLGTVVGGTMVLLGQFWGTVIVSALCGVIADLILFVARYRSRIAACVAFGVFQFWTIAPLLPVVFGSDRFFQRIARRQGAEYADFMRSLFTPEFLLSFQILVCIVGVGAAYIGTKIIDRHFSRSGAL